jgi:hypothetical protein
MGDRMPLPFMTREVVTHQRGVVNMYAKVDGSAVAGGTDTINGLDIGAAQHMTISENGDGDYTLTLTNPGQRFVGLFATSITDDANCTCSIGTDGTSATVKQTDLAAAALADGDFFLMMAVSHAADAT